MTLFLTVLFPGVLFGANTVLFFGDSLTAGYGLTPDQAYPAIIAEKFEDQGLDWETINGGLSGETSAGGFRRIDWMLRREPDILVIALGANDFLRGLSIEQTRQNLQGIIDKARERYPEVRIILAGMKAPPNLGEDYVEAFNRIYPKLAEKNEATLIPFLLANVGGKPELNQADGIHPNVQGQRIVAENVWKKLRPLIAEMNADTAAEEKAATQ